MATSQLLVPIFCGGLVAWAVLMARRLFSQVLGAQT